MKRLKVNVDTLTLTATPIPRTLQFSLMGARDLFDHQHTSAEQVPVQTEVHPFREDIIREAVSYELERGGQVFVVNTRVQNIGRGRRNDKEAGPPGLQLQWLTDNGRAEAGGSNGRFLLKGI